MRNLFRIHFLWVLPGNSETTSAMAGTNRRFPRYVALGALLIYVLTLSRIHAVGLPLVNALRLPRSQCRR